MKHKIRLKQSAYILKESDDVYQVVYTATRRIRRFKVDHLVRDAIDAVKSEEDYSNVVSRLKLAHKEEDIHLCFDSLEMFGIVTRYGNEQGRSRFQRQVSFIDELTGSWEETLRLQKKLENSTVAVFGVGGIGTWIVNGLYQIGIGSIRICDPDTVSEENLNRQLYFTGSDVGRFKVDVLKQRLGDAHLCTFKKRVSAEQDLEEVVEGCDFLINCADEPSVADTSRVINEYAVKYHIPYSVAGGYNLHLGMVGPIVVPGETACFDCFLAYQKENDPLSTLEKIKDLDQTGSLGPIAGVIANLHVMEVFKFMIGKGSTNKNKFMEIDFMNFEVMWREFSKRTECSLCGSYC